jgi:uncharacterized membrane protein
MKKVFVSFYMALLCLGFSVAPAAAQSNRHSTAVLQPAAPAAIMMQGQLPPEVRTQLDRLFGIVQGVVEYILGKRYWIAAFALVGAAMGWAFFGRRQGSEWMRGAIIIALIVGLLPMLIGMFVNLS